MREEKQNKKGGGGRTYTNKKQWSLQKNYRSFSTLYTSEVFKCLPKSWSNYKLTKNIDYFEEKNYLCRYFLYLKKLNYLKVKKNFRGASCRSILF